MSVIVCAMKPHFYYLHIYLPDGSLLRMTTKGLFKLYTELQLIIVKRVILKGIGNPNITFTYYISLHIITYYLSLKTITA